MGSPFLYAGYSAGICVLAPDLNGISIVDKSHAFFYPGVSEPIWDGLKLLEYIILPHYRSDHPASADIERDATRCRELGIPFTTLRDGEVLWGDDLGSIKSLHSG
jgi:dipeptidase E